MNNRLKRDLSKKFKQYGLSLRADAMKRMIGLYHDFSKNDGALQEQFDQFIDEIGKAIVAQTLESTLISFAQLEAVIVRILSHEDPIQNDILKIIDSFTMDRYCYKKVRKSFYKVSNNQLSIHGNATDLGNIFRHRYSVLLQRILRHKIFEKSTFKPNEFYYQLTTICELIGTKGIQTVFGMLSDSGIDETKLYLEDLNGTIEINLNKNNNLFEKEIGLYTHGSFVLVDGIMDNINNIFNIKHIRMPLNDELRSQTLNTFKNLNFNNFDKQNLLYKHEQESEDETFIFVSNIYLDTQSSLDKMEILLRGYSGCDVPPSLFIFMGNFTLKPLGSNPKDMKKLKEYFDKLCDIILKHGKLVRHSQFIIIPGPNDPGVSNGVLPMPRFIPSLTSKLESKLKCICMSNPCRIQFCTQEIVIFRYDLLSKMRRSCVTVPNLLESKDLCEHLAHSVIDQACLVPLPMHVVPIYWNFSHCLQLYPSPDLVVIADTHEEYECQVTQETTVVCPGQFNSQGSFLAYTPYNKEIDFSQLDSYHDISDVNNENDNNNMDNLDLSNINMNNNRNSHNNTNNNNSNNHQSRSQSQSQNKNGKSQTRQKKGGQKQSKLKQTRIDSSKGNNNNTSNKENSNNENNDMIMENENKNDENLNQSEMASGQTPSKKSSNNTSINVSKLNNTSIRKIRQNPKTIFNDSMFEDSELQDIDLDFNLDASLNISSMPDANTEDSQ